MAKATMTWNKNEVNRLIKHMRQGLVMMASDIANTAGDLAPYDTGALSTSIRVVDGRDRIEVLAGGQSPNGKIVNYARIHEFGGKTGRGYRTTITPKHYMQGGVDKTISGNWQQKYFGGFK